MAKTKSETKVKSPKLQYGTSVREVAAELERMCKQENICFTRIDHESCDEYTETTVANVNMGTAIMERAQEEAIGLSSYCRSIKMKPEMFVNGISKELIEIIVQTFIQSRFVRESDRKFAALIAGIFNDLIISYLEEELQGVTTSEQANRNN